MLDFTLNSFFGYQQIDLGYLYFGIYKPETNEWGGFETIINPDQNYTVTMALDFRGLGLPQDDFNILASMISQISNGTFYCQDLNFLANSSLLDDYGSCIAPNPCESYPHLWDFVFWI